MKTSILKFTLPAFLFMLLQFPLVSLAQNYSSTKASSKSWVFNAGLDLGGWWGGTGVTPLQPATDPLVQSNLPSQLAYSSDISLEWLHKKSQPDLLGPGFGIKTKLVWDYFTAGNGGSGNGAESLTLNYINVPVLLEYCLSFKHKVTQAHYFAPTSSTQTSVYDHGYYQHIITTTSRNPGWYYPGGVPYTNATFIFLGPQICYMIQGYHHVKGSVMQESDPSLQKAYVGLVGGFYFDLAGFINVNISYQRGLTSIYSGKNVYVNGFIFGIGINLTRRKYS
ncbi:MAG: hypothetical protein ACYCOO_04240 [Chitinophagaceae bacterium]